MILFTATPLVFLALRMHLDSLGDEEVSASLSFFAAFTASSLSWVSFFLPLQKKKGTKNCVNMLWYFQHLQTVQCKVGMEYLM